MMLTAAVQRYGQRVARQKAMFERLDSGACHPAPAVPVIKQNEEINLNEKEAYMQRKALSEIVRSNCNELIVS